MEYDWVDTTREDTLAPTPGTKRELLVWLWYPAATGVATGPADYIPGRWASALEQDRGVGSLFVQRLEAVRVHAIASVPLATTQTRYPVLILMPGYGSIPANYTTLAEDLASHGYVVAGIAPTYSAPVVVFPDGRKSSRTPAGSIPDVADPAVATKAADALVAVWAADVRFVLDELANLDGTPDGPFAGQLDMARVGVFGHSFGGAAAAEACRLDSRCRAGADLDGTLYGEVAALGLAQPFLFVSSECSGAPDAPCAQDERVWAAVSGDYDYRLAIQGARHFNFADYALFFGPPFRLLGLLGPIDGHRGLAITTAYVRAFFDHELTGAAAPLLRGPSPDYPEVRFAGNDHAVSLRPIG